MELRCDLDSIVEAVNEGKEFDYLKHQYFIFHNDCDFKKFMNHVDYTLDRYSAYKSVKTINDNKMYDKFNAKIYAMIDTIEGMIDDYNDKGFSRQDEEY